VVVGHRCFLNRHSCQSAGWRHFRQTEVQNLRVAAPRYKDICRFDITMNDPFGVSSLERVGNLNRQIE